jgi:arylsulfatase A-like enzyme
MTRRTFLGAAGAAASQPAPRVPGQRPNLLLILTDQQSVYALGANGNRDLATPAMDSLVENGVSFHESYSTYPVCSPARSSIFTSRMPHETGVMDNGIGIAAGMPTMGDHFRENGYETVYSGKWHLPKSFADPQGFRQLYGGASLAADMDEPTASACVKWLSAKPRQPFLMVCSLMNPHDVCYWIREHKGRREYPNLARFPQPRANMAVDPNEPEYIQNHRNAGYNLMSEAVGIAKEWHAGDFRYYLHDYYRMVEAVDRQVGRLLSALRLAGLDRNTTILFTSDHGEGMGAHRWVQKAAFWEEAVKTPLVVAGQGVRGKGEHNTRDLASGLDIFPTLCDYAGIAPPEGIRGSSLRTAIEGGFWQRSYLVSELAVYGVPERQGRMLRTQRHKYVVFNGGARPEQLFDLDLDPGEVYNLAGQAGSAPVLQEHRNLLRAWMAETKDPFRIPA